MASSSAILVLAVYALRLFVVLGYDIFEYDFRAGLWGAGVFVLTMLVAYTIIGTKIYVSEFNRAQRRLGNYMELIKMLNDTSGTQPIPVVPEPDWEQESEHEQEEPERGADLYYTRNDSELL